MQKFRLFMEDLVANLRMPEVTITDILEILIISFLIYQIMTWIKNTRAWSLLKGLVVILGFLLMAAVFNMDTILWIANNVLGFAVTALVVVLQPELRKALEELGKKNILYSFLPFESNKTEEGRFSDKTVYEITKACVEMGRTKTGALIVMKKIQSLSEYERTGIDIDAIVTSQLLINIFEHNTPLHDGAVIVNGNRIASATCYLPLSGNMELSKELGTRHRAGVGISEVTDSLTIIVSEETGKISVAFDGKLERNIDADRLRERLIELQDKPTEEGRKHAKRKVRLRNEKQNSK